MGPSIHKHLISMHRHTSFSFVQHLAHVILSDQIRVEMNDEAERKAGLVAHWWLTDEGVARCGLDLDLILWTFIKINSAHNMLFECLNAIETGFNERT